MKNKKIVLISVSILLIFAFQSFATFSSAATGTEIPSSYYQKYPGTLTYNVLNFNSNISVDWYLYVNQNYSINRGYWGTNDGGKIVVNISSFADVDPDLWWMIDNNPVPYGNISIFKSGETTANFTADNVSVPEMSYMLSLSFLYWCPGFLVSTNWTANGEKALRSSLLVSMHYYASIVNTTNTVKYIIEKFRTGASPQDTTLLYNRTNGILLEAITNVGNYELHIRLDTYTPMKTVGAYFPITLLASGIIGISVIWLKYSKKMVKK